MTDRRDYHARYRAANRDMYRESTRKWRVANEEAVAAQRIANQDKYNASRRGKADPASRERHRSRQLRYRHGTDIGAVVASMWEEQGGKCYLCGIYLVPWGVHIDHDHRCCPPTKTCEVCRRGLACDHCNTLIGLADDDPPLLHQIADNLAAKLVIVNERLARKPAQLAINDPEESRL